ncbi:hypothetical protein ACQZEU_12455, partial [Corynebacterium diphtheriae]
NVVSALLLSGGHDHHHGHDHGHDESHHAHGHDNNLRSAYVHVIADALTSVLAIAALLAGRYLGWVWLDLHGDCGCRCDCTLGLVVDAGDFGCIARPDR